MIVVIVFIVVIVVIIVIAVIAVIVVIVVIVVTIVIVVIVSRLQGTDRPTDRQCQLLSCPGQLKTLSKRLSKTIYRPKMIV